MYYTYVLKPKGYNVFLVGSTDNLENKNFHSQKGGWDFLYFEQSPDMLESLEREKFLRTTEGKQYITNLIKEKDKAKRLPIML